MGKPLYTFEASISTSNIPKLRTSREVAKQKLGEQIKRGREILDRGWITNESDLDKLQDDTIKWTAYVRDLLATLFYGAYQVIEEFDPPHGGYAVGQTFQEKKDNVKISIRRKVTTLESIEERLEFADISGPPETRPAQRAASPVHGSHVFISHSSQDAELVSTVKHAFYDLSIKAYFAEDEVPGGPPPEVLAERVRDSRAVFVFFTFNTISGDTRDWIVFELGVAKAHNMQIHSWKQSAIQKDHLPKLVPQITMYHDFDVSTQGYLKLQEEVRETAKKYVGFTIVR